MSDTQKECIIILGMHRSGTSVLTGLISSLGGDIGSDIMPPTQDNPKGYFENNHIYNLNRSILRENSADWDTAEFNFADIDNNKKEAYIKLAEKILVDEFRYIRRIIIKDPRVCLLFPIWERALSNLNITIKVILPIRNPLEVARSLLKRNSFSIEHSIHLWASHVFKAEQYSRTYPRQYIAYPQDYEDQDVLISQLSNFIGIEPKNEAIKMAKALYSPSLTHHHIDFDNISNLPPVLMRLISFLKDKEILKPEAYDKIRDEFYSEQQFYTTPLKAEIKNKEKESEEASQKNLSLSQANTGLNEQNKTLAIDKIALEKTNLQLEQHKDKLERNKTELEQRKNELEKANKILLEEKTTLQNQLISEGKAFERYRGEKTTFITRLKSDIAKLLEKIKKVEDDYHNLREDRDLLSNQLKGKNESEAQLRFRLNNAFDMLDTLSTKRKSKALLNYIDAKNLPKKYQKKWYWPIQRKPLATRRKRLIAESGLFSPVYYLTSYPDVRKSGMPPLEHFYKFGWKEGRRPSQEFDPKNYLRANPDVAQSGMNPLLHYISHGKSEGRSPLPKVKQPVRFKPIQPTSSQGVQKALPTKGSQGMARLNDDNFGPVIPRNWYEKIDTLQHIQACGLAADTNKEIPQDIISELIQKTTERKSPLISIIMPCWNREGVINDAINSVLQQSYQNIELIISDDGSTDNTCQEVERTFSQAILTKKIKLIRNEHHGVCAARNAGLAAASGDFIAYLDSDNQWREHYLIIMVNAFLESDELYCAYSALLSHDNNRQSKRLLSQPYNRKQLLTSNFIDLNVFMHRASLYQQYGGFDESLTRLVDWELIIRYTKHHEPAHLPFIGVDYYLDHEKFNNITTSVGLDDNRDKVYKRHFSERLRHGLEPLRLAYILWDFPSLSQTFVINELRWLIAHNFDVFVYYAVAPDKAATLDFEIPAFKTNTPDELSTLLVEHERNYCHSHFAYPAVTRLTWPACSALNIPFTFMPHAVDIFHHENQKRNHIGTISQSPLCQKVFVHGQYHKTFLEKQGVPSEKMAYNFQAVNESDFLSPKRNSGLARSSEQKIYKGIVLSRFVEKKGIEPLIEAAALLQNNPVCFEVYGYGPLEADYQALIKKKQLTNIKLMGALEGKDSIRALYASSDFLIAPCVEARNGDRDGFPTVILEAFAMEIPVITTDIAAIPDYLTDNVQALISSAGNINDLVKKIRELLQMSPTRREALTRQAKHFLQTKVGTNLSMSFLTDVWLDKKIDLFLVSFNNEQYDDEAETLEIIRRLLAYTTTPFTLTIVDNNSDKSFWENIQKQVAGRCDVRLIRKNNNLMCGPSSNIALEMGDAEFAIYICAKEGFVAKHGWERTLLNAMRENPNAALGGHHCHMPRFVYGHEYENHPDFDKYRNKDFLAGRSEQAFTHIQGGIFITRRNVFEKHGGFNPLIPHGGMDIELSYYYESLGYELLEIPEVASLTVKTRPVITSIIDENTVIAHPLTVKSVDKQLDKIVAKKTKQCNICGWQGLSFGKGLSCPECKSTPEGRLVYRYIVSDYRIHRKSKALALSNDAGLTTALKNLFSVTSSAELVSLHDRERFACIVLTLDAENSSNNQDLSLLYKMLDNDGRLITIENEMTASTPLPSLPTYYSASSVTAGFTWKRLLTLKTT